MADTPKHSVRKHSNYSASAAKRWLSCPGSIERSKGIPPLPDSKYAREGTDAHECLEFLVRRYKGLKTAIAEAEKRWPADMVEHCVNSAHYVFKMRPSPTAKLLIESRVSLKHIAPGMFGTLDYAWVEDWGWLKVIDFKYGAGVTVLAYDNETKELNPQLMYYAAGIAKKFNYDFERIEIAVIQPRVYAEGEQPVQAVTLGMKEIYAFEKTLANGVKQSKQPNAPLKAGDHCRWCPAQPTCPEVQRSMAAVDVVFDLDDGLQAVPEVRGLTPTSLPKLLEACDRLEFWIDAVRSRAQFMAESGTEIPGYKLVAKRAHRKWDDGSEAKAFHTFGAGVYEISRRMLSPAQIAKQFGATGKAFVNQNTLAVSSGFKLVPEKYKSIAVETALPFDIDDEPVKYHCRRCSDVGCEACS